ncbi:Cyclic nucleotide-binding domain-containing protein [Fibrobacter sp. UWH5]|uniref:cyclic nucleotide-binding domain-containing protein n=1 Tax=Fibrobacter sp. UWH5 TaxID=1896211 RepID=UPI000916FB31|nr:cyclic nucleotide-binding domain-containing protein [Fibrobacter sp. UWH5]MCQ2099353.1 cyclic nucleotide-binding domain-containing protein [Fibrobacter sp.]SHK40137.1 Cyclic nucleotide-binding domain-containing protein [Fibrobacter sp. UWH5]
MILNAGEYLCTEGDKNNTLFIVKSGELEGSSSKKPKIRLYGPGSIIGEFSLLEGAAAKETLKAKTQCELQVINPAGLQDALAKEPSWLMSIITFLASRTHIAKNNLIKSNKVKALPALLYLLSSRGTVTPVQEICEEVHQLFNIDDDETMGLLQTLQSIDVLKVLGDEIRIESPRVISLLYKTICYRAIHKKVSPSILSMTEQMVLTAVTKTVQESRDPLKNGTFTIQTETLMSIAKKSLHLTLTLRTIQPLIQRGLLIPSAQVASPNSDDPLESIQSFRGDFEKVLDLLELNRIFPMLDKHLVS